MEYPFKYPDGTVTQCYILIVYSIREGDCGRELRLDDVWHHPRAECFDNGMTVESRYENAMKWAMFDAITYKFNGAPISLPCTLRVRSLSCWQIDDYYTAKWGRYRPCPAENLLCCNYVYEISANTYDPEEHPYKIKKLISSIIPADLCPSGPEPLLECEYMCNYYPEESELFPIISDNNTFPELIHDFKINPNVVLNNLSIYFGNQSTNIFKINIVDVLGNIMIEKDIKILNNSMTIDVSKLLPGVYNIILCNNQNKYVKKFIKI